MIRVAINGYGRIGRCLVRAIYERGLQEQIVVVAINDLADFEVLAHLTRHDSTHGHFHIPVSINGDQMAIGDWTIQMTREKDPAALPWKALGVDIALECSGKFKARQALSAHLGAGARRVLASFPVADADRTIVIGVNDHDLRDDDAVVSNASCTTNCLAPLVKVLDDAFGFEQGQMTTIHAYTNDQNLIDKAHSDMYRARSATMSMIPTKTGAAKAVGLVLPHLKGKLDGMAIRVPTLNVSMVDLHCQLKQDVTPEAINDALRQAAAGSLKGILGVNEEPLVSWDFNHNPLSSIVDLAQTRTMGRQAKLMSWYDNEWGFTERMVDMIIKMG
ncbi:MAG: type I glyceraldehyde-3-phosphate dehydrogenase [Gammaproteobacteria bacterium HGW-Gammaproteobacteria-14]|nr:MAG: type I glyceraldehyde-3-phosphate dehydrogenase [Gammaproteobacteria bacterium HGW-Gammaproteobacteria-14]